MLDANKALTALINTHTASLFSVAYTKVHDKEAVKDIVQNTFLAALNGYHSLQNQTYSKTWLFAILQHKIVDFLRQKSACIEYSCNTYSSFFLNIPSIQAKGNTLQAGEAADDIFENQAFRKVLVDSINELPENWRHIIRLKYFEKRDTRTICKTLNITPANFWQITHRAKRQLKKSLEKKWFGKSTITASYY